MFGMRHLDQAYSSQMRPGDNKVRLCTAPDEAVAEGMVRTLAMHEIDCATQRRLASKNASSGEPLRLMVVDLHVRGSDLERARRIVHGVA